MLCYHAIGEAWSSSVSAERLRHHVEFLLRRGYEPRRFIDVAAAQERLRFAQDAATIARRTLDAIAIRVEAAAVPVAEQTRAQIALTRAEIEAEQAGSELRTARFSLAALWGDTEPSFENVNADLFRFLDIGSFEAFFGQLQQSPDFLAFMSATRLRDAELRLAEAQARPNIAVSLGLRRFEETDDLALVAGFSRPIAIRDRNEGAIYEARAGESIEDVLRIAGGPTNLADAERVVLYRLRDRDSDWSHQLSRSEAAGRVAEAGDIIQILPQGSLVRPLERQAAIVRLEGEVNRPGNYYVPANTPLSTVIDMAGGLTARAYVFGTKLTRETVRAQQRESYKDALDQMEQVLITAPLTHDVSIPGDRTAQLASVRDFLAKLREAEPDGRLVLDLQPGTTQLPGNLVLENNDRIVVPPRIETVGVFGAVYRPASFLLSGQPKRVRDYIEQAGGTIRAADKGTIFVVRANGEVLSKKRGALNARVLPGDIVFVPVRTQGNTFWARFKDITQTLFQLGLSAATVAAIGD